MRRWTAAPLTFTLTETSAALGTRPSIGAVAVCGCEGGAYCSCAEGIARRILRQQNAAGHPLHSVLYINPLYTLQAIRYTACCT